METSTVTAPSPEQVRAFIRTFLIRRFESQERCIPPEIPDDCDLLLSGYIDSLGFLELVTSLNEFTGREIDLDSLDPEKMTVFGPLSEFVSAQCAGD
jgi:acyl carrier protein